MQAHGLGAPADRPFRSDLRGCPDSARHARDPPSAGGLARRNGGSDPLCVLASWWLSFQSLTSTIGSTSAQENKKLKISSTKNSKRRPSCMLTWFLGAESSCALVCDQTLPPRNVLGVAKHPAQRASQDAGLMKYMFPNHFVLARRAASWPFVAKSCVSIPATGTGG